MRKIKEMLVNCETFFMLPMNIIFIITAGLDFIYSLSSSFNNTIHKSLLKICFHFGNLCIVLSLIFFIFIEIWDRDKKTKIDEMDWKNRKDSLALTCIMAFIFLLIFLCVFGWRKFYCTPNQLLGICGLFFWNFSSLIYTILRFIQLHEEKQFLVDDDFTGFVNA